MITIRLWVLVAMAYAFGALTGFALGGAYQLDRVTKQMDKQLQDKP
jgi:hypothetical protein